MVPALPIGDWIVTVIAGVEADLTRWAPEAGQAVEPDVGDAGKTRETVISSMTAITTRVAFVGLGGLGRLDGLNVRSLIGELYSYEENTARRVYSGCCHPLNSTAKSPGKNANVLP